MRFSSRIVRSCLLVIAPMVTTAAIAVSPTQAATFASSRLDATVNNFSQDIDSTATDANTQALAQGFSADTNVFAVGDAQSAVLQQQGQFVNFSFGQSGGTSGQYFGSATSFASALGQFLIPNGEAFSFDFNAVLGLQAAADNLQLETATATGNIVFRLIDNRTQTLLDVFGISGQSTAQLGTTFNFFGVNGNVNANPSARLFPDGSAVALLTGTYSRTFGAGADLTLEEVKVNQVEVTSVPEPSGIGGIMLVIALLGRKTCRDRGRKLLKQIST